MTIYTSKKSKFSIWMEKMVEMANLPIQPRKCLFHFLDFEFPIFRLLFFD